MSQLWYAMIIIIALLWSAPVLAEDVTPHTVIITVVDTNGAPRSVPELGCAWSADPVGQAGNYGSTPRCYECATVTCTFIGAMADAEGGYAVFGLSDDWNVPTRAPWTGLVGQEKPGQDWQVYVLWWTNAASSGNDWAGTHYITYTLTALPAPTPIPTPAGPNSVNLYEGMGSGFNQSYGQMSGAGVIPDFGGDNAAQWLFTSRKWIQFLNQGNLLYVMGGILLAMTVLSWAIKRVQNPR